MKRIKNMTIGDVIKILNLFDTGMFLSEQCTFSYEQKNRNSVSLDSEPFKSIRENFDNIDIGEWELKIKFKSGMPGELLANKEEYV